MDDRLNYIERPMAIHDRKMKTLRSKVVELLNVKWQDRKWSKWKWDTKEKMKEHYLELLVEADFKDEV